MYYSKIKVSRFEFYQLFHQRGSRSRELAVQAVSLQSLNRWCLNFVIDGQKTETLFQLIQLTMSPRLTQLVSGLWSHLDMTALGLLTLMAGKLRRVYFNQIVENRRNFFFFVFDRIPLFVFIFRLFFLFFPGSYEVKIKYNEVV